MTKTNAECRQEREEKCLNTEIQNWYHGNALCRCLFFLCMGKNTACDRDFPGVQNTSFTKTRQKILRIMNNICPSTELFPQIKADCRACSNLALIRTALTEKPCLTLCYGRRTADARLTAPSQLMHIFNKKRQNSVYQKTLLVCPADKITRPKQM